MAVHGTGIITLPCGILSADLDEILLFIASNLNEQINVLTDIIKVAIAIPLLTNKFFIN